jgi:hypothetical protein
MPLSMQKSLIVFEKFGGDHLGKCAINLGKFRACVDKIDQYVVRIVINKYEIIFRFSYNGSEERSLNIILNQIKSNMRK